MPIRNTFPVLFATAISMLGVLASEPVHSTPIAAAALAVQTPAPVPELTPGLAALDDALRIRDEVTPNARQRSTMPRHAPVNGGVAIVPLPDSLPMTLPLLYQGQPVWTGHVQSGGPRVAVVGLPLQAEGEQQLTDAEGRVAARWLVMRKTYPEQRLVLKDTRYVTPDEEQLARFAREAELQKQTYRQFSTAPGRAMQQPLWPVFRWPLSGRLSSPFGLQRFFNDVPKAPHLGLDIAGRTGEPVVAPADGRVALTGDFFFNGRTVILDHGQGLFSMLCHFDEIRVQQGDMVTAGTTVGTVGATGRATGPHLHWTVSLNDARIDPRWLLTDK